MICGGIDLGGTKIEARLFDGTEVRTVGVRRIATPTESYRGLLEALMQLMDWLIATAGVPKMPIGLAIPGIVDPTTGVVFAANLPASGQTLRRDLEARLRRRVTVLNDCMAFAISEATGGAAADARTVMGLTLGTGVGGGLCIDRAFPPRLGGLAVEVGHIGLSADAHKRHNLPIQVCGCGRSGCVETYVSGNGISNIAMHRRGAPLAAEAIVAQGDEEILEIWADLTGETLSVIQLMLAPDCVVLGGGLSKIPQVAQRLSASLKRHLLGVTLAPRIVVAQHGDSSGARGAALMACKQ